MATTYQISINLNDETLSALKEGSWQLQAFKGVKSTSTQLYPTVWFNVTDFSTNVVLSWQEQYGGYVNNQTLSHGITVDVSSQQPMNFGDLMTLNTDGSTQVSTRGLSGAVSIYNTIDKLWHCGVTQSMNGEEPTPICAFPLYGNTTNIMAPYEKVILVFAQNPIDTGTVVKEAISASLSITLSGTTPGISVSFDINKSWDTKGQTNATVNLNPINLAEHLVIPL
jgi:hypothetical protein